MTANKIKIVFKLKTNLQIIENEQRFENKRQIWKTIIDSKVFGQINDFLNDRNDWLECIGSVELVWLSLIKWLNEIFFAAFDAIH